MILRAYSIFDRKALSYHPPYYAGTDGQAVRTLSDVVADTNSMLSRHPNDFVLFHVGDFDDQKGSFKPVSPIVHIIDAIALVAAMQSEIPFPEKLTVAEQVAHAKERVNGPLGDN